MRRGGLALIAILVVGSLTKLLLPQNQAAPNAEPSRGAATTSAAASQPAETNLQKAQGSVQWFPNQLRERIRDFFGAEQGPALESLETGGKPKPDSAGRNNGELGQICESLKNWCVPSPYRAALHFVIAAVPDPVHTHLGLFFDRSIDAIQQGATSQEYLFDRAVMPWQYFIVQNQQETEEDRLLRKVRESYPGLMIFRKKKPDQALFVFVVGETPTAGINKEQFYRAVQMIHEIRQGEDTVASGQPQDFAVLGPSFSGSLYSLQEIFKGYLQKYWKGRQDLAPTLPVYAVVMAHAAIQDFQENAPPQARAAIFMEDSQEALEALQQFTGGLGYHDSDIVLLNEDDTAYGTSYGSANPTSATGRGTLSLSFPRGISQFRSAYSKDVQIQDQTADPNQSQRRNLRLDLDVTGSDDDNVAPYAEAQTALSQEAIMLEIVSELRRLDSKFVLIRATDPLDELFLARYLASEYPGARLVVPTPDLLFARDEGGVLDGSLGLNTYPVSPSYLNQLCKSPGEPPNSSFPAASSAGLYNATVALLGGLSTPVPLSTAPANACQLSPHLWLTMVSRNTFHPIQVLDSKASLFFPDSGGGREEELSKRSGRIDTPWAILCLVCLALVVNQIRGLHVPNPLGYWGTVKPPENPKDSRITRDRLLWLGALVLLAILAVFISSVTLVPNARHFSATWLIVIVLWTSWIAFVGYVTHDFCKARNRPVLAYSFFTLSVCLTAVGVFFAYTKYTSMVLWEQRILDLASQASPATPLLLLLAAGYVWFWFSLKAESIVDWRSPRLPDEAEPIAEAIRRVIPSFTPPAWVHAGAGIVTGLIALRGMEVAPGGIPIRSLEGYFYDFTYSVLFACGVYFLVATLLRTLAVWINLRFLLFALDRPGMKQALDRLKGFGWNDIWNPLESMQEEAGRMYWKGLQVVERLEESLDKPPDGGKPDPFKALRSTCRGIIERWKEILVLLKGAIPGGTAKPVDVIAPVKEMQENLAQLATALLKDHLEPSWKSLPADDEIGSSSETPQDSPQTRKIVAEIKEADNSLRAIVRGEIMAGDKSPARDPSTLPVKSAQLAEELVACVYATFITVVLLRIRWLVFSAVMIYTAIVFSSASYPFQPAATLRTLALLLFLLGGVVVGYVYEEMHRNETLRRITSTDPNKIDSALWLKVASAGLLPLLGLLSTLFPQIGHFLYSLAAPILQATR